MLKQTHQGWLAVGQTLVLSFLAGVSGPLPAQSAPAGPSVRPGVESLGSLRGLYQAALRDVRAARASPLPVPAGFVRSDGPNPLSPRLMRLTTTYAGRATPRDKDGHPDLTGAWASQNAMIFAVAATSAPRSPYDPVDLALALQVPDMKVAATERLIPTNIPLYKPELVEKVRGLYRDRLAKDPTVKCAWPGLPRMGAPTYISQTGTILTLLYNDPSGPLWRIIDMKRTSIAEDADSAFGGVSLGHWEGDTLVVEAQYLPSETWFGEYGYFHGPNMKITERFHRTGDLITYQVTVEDPTVLTRPWTRDPIALFRTGGAQTAEPVTQRCTTGHADEAEEKPVLFVTRLY